MRKSIALAAAAATLAAPLIASAPVSAAVSTGAPEVAWVNPNVRVVGDSAFVTAKYRCSPATDATHLWVSVKQGGTGLDGEGSGGTAQSWYDTNVTRGGTWEEPGPEIPVTCDGTWQHQTVEVQRYADKRPLERGAAYVQFCLYTIEGEEVLSATENRWATAKRG
jgi:hypothetical protein